jgi:integrase
VLRVPAGDAKSAEAEEIALHPKARSAIRAEAADRGVVDQAVPVFGAFDLRRAWRKALAASGIDPTGVTTHHSARHTFGSLVAESSGGDVSAVLAAGRWRSLSVAQRYVHASAERGRAAIRKL